MKYSNMRKDLHLFNCNDVKLIFNAIVKKHGWVVYSKIYIFEIILVNN